MKTNACPRCTHPMSLHPALSRTDNKTSVCGNCGLEEAIEVFERGACSVQHEWPLKPTRLKFLWSESC